MSKSFLKRLFPSPIGIDFGSDTIRVYVKDEGLVVDEPSLVAVKDYYPEKDFLQFGTEAAKLIGRTPTGINVVRPVRRGSIQEIAESEALLEQAMNKAMADLWFKPTPKVYMAVSSSASEVELKALEDVIHNAGTSGVDFIKKGLAGAIGAGINISSVEPSCVIDIGGETTEIAVVGSNTVIHSKTFDVGSYDLAKGIVNVFMNRESPVDIGIENGFNLLKNLANIIHTEVSADNKIVVEGKDIAKKRPVKMEVSEVDVYMGIYDQVQQILHAVDEVFGEVSAEALSAFYKNGITLIGGGSGIHGLVEVLSETYPEVEIKIAKDPEKCVINGLGMIMEDKVVYNRY